VLLGASVSLFRGALMRVAVFGAGAVGGYLAAQLLQSGAHEVAVVARGAQAQAIAARGITVRHGQNAFTVRPHALATQARELPPQDLVFVTTKGHDQPAAAADIVHLIGAHGTAVFMCNGIPWWWSHHGAERPGTSLPLLDPQAALWTQVGPQRALGCVVYSANEVVEPGVILHSGNNHWLLGEPDGRPSERLQQAVQALRVAGLQAEVPADLRTAVWTKLLRNVPLNTVCALTRLPVEGLAADATLVALCHQLIDEVVAVAAAHGADLSAHVATARQAPERGGAVGAAQPLAPVRPSMLQDVMQGRRLEIDAIVGQLQQLARDVGVTTPAVDVLLPLLRGLQLSLD
jgi:2-dehydropantoate 2-reductase